MAVAFTNLAKGDSATDSSSYVTTSISPTANRLVLFSVTSRTFTSTDPNIPTLTGAGLTWVQVSSLLFDSASASRRRVTVFRALGPSPVAGALTIDFGGQTQTAITWVADEASGTDTSGTHGSGAIVQVATNKDETLSVNTLTVTLGTFASSSNATYGAFGTDATYSATAGSGFTLLADSQDSEASISTVTEWRTDNDTTVDVTLGGNVILGGIAIEIKAVTAGSSESPSISPSSSASASQSPSASTSPSSSSSSSSSASVSPSSSLSPSSSSSASRSPSSSVSPSPIPDQSIRFQKSLYQSATIASGLQTGLTLNGSSATFEAWVKLSSLPSEESYFIIQRGDTAGTNGFYAFYIADESNVKKLRFYIGNGASQVAVTENYDFQINTWYHVAASFNDGTNSVQLYLNGSPLGSPHSMTLSIPNIAFRFNVGVNVDNGAEQAWFDGYMDEVRVWSIDRSSAEISANYNQHLVGNEANLVAYYQFDGDTNDETSNNNDLTQNNTPTFSTDVPFTGSSASASISPSSSISASRSPSASLSPSSSASPSISPSASRSPSASLSPSSSTSASVSPSASPSSGYTGYTRGDEATLPTTDTDLENAYSAQDVTDVSTSNNVRVAQTATSQYAIHQYKNFAGTKNVAAIQWEGQTNLSPATSTVFLQIYNRSSGLWETLASNNTAAVNTDFTLTASVNDLTNYKSAGGVISCRIYQLAL